MSALDTSNEFRRSGSFLDRAKERLHDAVETVKQVGNDIKTDVIEPLEEAGKNIKESADIMKEGASALKDMASQLTPDASLETIGKAAEKFDGDWDKFAADFDKKYRTIKEAGEDNVLETMVRQTFGNKVFEAGSIIKNEAPNLLNGISGIQNGVSTISAGQGDLLTRAKEIKDSTAKIIESVKQVDASLNNVFTRVTNQLAVDATALIGLQQKLHDVVGKANTCIPDGLKSSASRLGDGIDALDAGRTMITAMIADCQGQVSAQGLANLANHFDKNWDNFAQKANDLYAHLSGDDKVNIFEAIAKSQFGDNVFYAGSAIKNEMPNVLSGISDFQNSVNIFKGDYSTPQAAVNTIKNGVEGIVRATEKIAKSINNAIKIYKGRGNTQNVTGLPLLDNMSKIGDAAVVKALGNSLALGADGLSAANNFSALQADLKSGNLSKAWKDLQALIKDTGKVAKDINNLIKGKRPKGFDDGQSASSQKDSEKEEKKEEEKDDKAAKLSLGSDSYVCSGATLRCPFGDRTSKLSVYPDRMVYLTGQPMANVSDHISMYNIHPFGKCRTRSYPPTGSATAANHGVLTPMPCVPGTMSNWMQGKTDYIVKGHHALLKTSYCKCQWGGIITITDDGQRDTGKPDMSRERRETPEEVKVKQQAEELAENAALDPNLVLDGIQAALDLAGFAPGVGAIPDLLNAAISACRGNWAEAGLSVLAAVPGIGDAAAGIKFANKGLKMVKAGEKVEKTAEVGKGLNKVNKVEEVSKPATNAKPVSKTESKPTDLSEYRKAKQDKLIDESPNIKRFPKQKAPADTPASSMENGKSGDLVYVEHYEVKQVKVGNGKTENVLEKKTDTIVDSIGGVSGGGSTRGYGYTGPQASGGKVQRVEAPNSVFDATSKRKQSQGEIIDIFKNKKARIDDIPFH